MEISKLVQICKQNEYPDEFSHDLVCMYPFMVKKYGQESIDKFLNEWKYKFTKGSGASGSVDRNKKEINVNLSGWQVYDLHLYRLITATIHEVGHALGSLHIDNNSFLEDGKDNNDDFFTKMDEAVVSDYQDELLAGELEYNYTDSYNFKCRGDLQHYDTSYPIEKLYFNIFKILLGSDAELIERMMYETNIDNKKNIFENIVQILNSKLKENQFRQLINSCALLIYNHGYYGLYCHSSFKQRKEARRKQLYELNYEMVKNGEISLEEYNKEFIAWFEEMYNNKYTKVKAVVSANNLSDIGIREQCDKLSEVVLDYLIDSLNEMEDFDFELIRSACLYFTKINNINPLLKEKNQLLKELLNLQLSNLDISFSEDIISKFNANEIQAILVKLISLNGISIEKLNNLKLIIPEQQTNFTYFTDGNSVIKLGRYSDLKKDDFKKFHDFDFQGIYLDRVIPEIKLSRDFTFGDDSITNNTQISEQVLLSVSQTEKSVSKK